MLQITLVGNVGANAEKKSANGRNFTTFRVAHNDTWTDQAGQQHTNVQWIDCILNDHPKVVDFITQGTQVLVQGSCTLRVYSSPKERCMKAGLTVNVRHIELLGGKSDAVPSRLYDSNGAEHTVVKYFNTDVKSCTLMSSRGQQFLVSEQGWVTPQKQQPVGADAANNEQPESKLNDKIPEFF